jgi:acetylornithine/succinyldiaminopimelate/putrescine aminotransferase
MIGVSLESSEQVKQLQDHLEKEGVKSSLSTGKFIRFLPPTIITKEDIVIFLKKLDKALEKL